MVRIAERPSNGHGHHANGDAAGSLNGHAAALLGALQAVKKGDASVRLPLDWTGIDGKIADAFNDMVELNARTQSELARLSRVVGKEGKLKQRASLGDVTGFWRESVESINSLIEDLVHPSSEVARVIGAVAQGDLSKSMALEVEGRPLEGEFLRTARTINTMVDQLGTFAREVTRVAREVGTEGKLGGQADVQGVAGTWKDLTDSVNSMAGNLTGQVRNIAEVTTAVARGDLSKKITVDVKGELLELKNTINTMVDQLRSFAAEVTRVAREVGTEGKLGGQADVQGVSGTWKDLTQNVNLMASNLTGQVRNIAEVTTAVARGELSKKITVDVKGELLELKNTINTMVDQLRSFAAEVTRVAREVGTEGKLGGQADVQGVAGTWKTLTDSVNSMAGNLTGQVRNIAEVTTAVAMGDLSKKITVDVAGEILELKNTINTMVDQLRSFAAEVTRVAREVGTEGELGGQADVQGVAGTWKDLTESVNSMAGNLTAQVRNIADVTKAVAAGDLSKKIAVDVKGEILELKNTINTMVDQLRTFAGEVTRVAREVGTEGKLGGQAGGAGRGRHLEGPDRLGQLDGRQPHRPGARHRPRGDGGRQRRPQAQADRGSQGRDRGARRHHQQHDRYAGHLRRPGDDGGPRGGRRRPAGRPGQGAGRGGHVEGADGERQPARRQPHHPGARHRRGGRGRDAGRPDALDHRRCAGRGGRPEGHHQRDDPQPARHDAEEHRAGLAEDQPRQVQPPAAGPEGPGRGRPDDPVGAGAGGGRAAGRVLRARQRGRWSRA